ncbi:hypothetical protein OS965_41890, partial [Streptomyces sp. H27-G5]|uniref:hypothetical protein n=1 Tax=Streptomyces sp. H27-G5 TaxID=2996698 RepID=UPI0022721E77
GAARGDDGAGHRFASAAPRAAGQRGFGRGGLELPGREQRVQPVRLGAGAQVVREVGDGVGGDPAPGLLAVAAQLGVPVGDRLVALRLGDVDQGADVGVRGRLLARVGDLLGERPLADLAVGGGLADAVPLEC